MSEKEPELRAENPKFFWDEPPITPDLTRFYTQYVGLAEDEVVPHIKATRDKAWKKFPYPCIGLFQFAEFPIVAHTLYPEVASRARSGQTILDLGCCFGSDIRKLVFDGVPAENIHGLELEQEFLDMGYELFRDRHHLRSHITIDDFLKPKTEHLDGRKFDMIHASMLFHLFELDEQTEGYTRAVQLLKRKPGSVIFGRNTSLPEAQVLDSNASPTGRIFVHNEASFRSMIRSVEAKTATKLRVGYERREIPEYGLSDTRWAFQYYTITLESTYPDSLAWGLRQPASLARHAAQVIAYSRIGRYCTTFGLLGALGLTLYSRSLGPLVVELGPHRWRLLSGA